MKIKRFAVLSGVVGIMLPCLAGAEVIMDQNFESGFAPGVLPRSGAYRLVGNNNGTSIVNDGSQVLQVSRVSAGGIGFPIKGKLQPKRNYCLSFRFKAAKNNQAVLFINSNKVTSAGILLRSGAHTRAYDEKKAWRMCAGTTPVPADKWVTVKVDVNVAAKKYVVEIVNEDGTECFSVPFPLLSDELPTDVMFHNALPVGSKFLVDDIKLTMSGEVAGNQVKYDFENLKEGTLPARWRSTAGYWSNISGKDVSLCDAVNDGERGTVIRMIRQKYASSLTFYPSLSADKKADFAMDLKMSDKGVIALLFCSGKDCVGGIVVRGNGAVNGYNAMKKWVSSGIVSKFPANTYANIAVKFDYEKKSYTVSLNGSEGSVAHPMLVGGKVDNVKFVISFPLKSTAWIDNLTFDVE